MPVVVPDSAKARANCAKIIAAGDVVAFKTDTFYGLGADPFNAKALEAITRLKKRDARKPILVLISDSSQIRRFIASRTLAFEVLSKSLWPGPLTLVSLALESLPAKLTAGTGTIGIRVPAGKNLRSFIKACGGALTATSANPEGEPPAASAQEVNVYFRDELALVIDGGVVQKLQPSTVVNTVDVCAQMIREGVVPRADIENTLMPFNVPLR